MLESATSMAERRAQLEAELEAMKKAESLIADLQTLLVKYPQFRSDVVKELLGNDEQSTEVQQSADVMTNADKITDLLRGVKVPMTLKQISDKTGVPEASARQIIYTRNPDRFRRVLRPGR
jgi:hypothetical protein